MVTVLPITGHIVQAPLLRIDVGPDSGVGRPSQIQIDKLQAPRRERIGAVSGRAPDQVMRAVNRALSVFLGLA